MLIKVLILFFNLKILFLLSTFFFFKKKKSSVQQYGVFRWLRLSQRRIRTFRTGLRDTKKRK